MAVDNMTPEEALAELADISVRVDDFVTGTDPKDVFEDVDQSLQAWDTIDNMLAVLNVLKRELSTVVAEIVPEQYTTADGFEIHTVATKTEKWDGAGVLNALGQNMVDAESGEVVRAVPIETLSDVLPAVTGTATSSKWKIRGLLAHLPSVDQYHSYEYKKAQVRRGPKPKR